MSQLSSESFEPAEGLLARGRHAFEPDALSAARFSAHLRPLGVERGSEQTTEEGAVADAPLSGVVPPDLEAIEQEAFARGEAAGRAALPWSDADALQRALTALEQAARGVSALRRAELLEGRHAVVDLACAIAERILGRAIERDHEALVALVASALASFDAGEPLLVSVSPEDLAVLQPALSEPAVASSRELAFAADPKLERGTARVNGRAGEARAAVAIALERVRAGLEDLLSAPEVAEPSAAARASHASEPTELAGASEVPERIEGTDAPEAADAAGAPDPALPAKQTRARKRR